MTTLVVQQLGNAYLHSPRSGTRWKIQSVSLASMAPKLRRSFVQLRKYVTVKPLAAANRIRSVQKIGFKLKLRRSRVFSNKKCGFTFTMATQTNSFTSGYFCLGLKITSLCHPDNSWAVSKSSAVGGATTREANNCHLGNPRPLNWYSYFLEQP